MNREQRLSSARAFIRNYKGRHLARSYSRWYGVDRRCAILELQMLGVRLKPEYVAAVLETERMKEQNAIAVRQADVEPLEDVSRDWLDEDNMPF